MKYPIPAVIFAGGRSSRMGKDKALLPFAGYPSLVRFQYEKLQPLFETVYLSAKADKFDFDAVLLLDRYEVSSPLAGIISVFETLGEDEVFILSVDAPFVDENIIKTLMEVQRGEYDVIIAKTRSGLQPLCGIYRHSLLSLAKQQLARNRHRLTDLMQQLRCCYIYFEDEAPFANLNHPHEYESALLRLKHM